MRIARFHTHASTGNEPVMLSIQYRCHPQIANASNALFYENSLSTGESIEVSPVLKDTPALVFLDAREGQEEGSGSLRNTAEISLVLRIIRPLMRAGVPNNEIGIITFCEYFQFSIELKRSLRLAGSLLTRFVANLSIAIDRSQADAFRSQLRGSSEFNGLQVSTVDAFQGAEKAVILISTVRTKNTQFIDDPRRVNVALTRAKRYRTCYPICLAPQ
ncbi:AAA domain-containing protein [Zopfochytrium polystomum]|nr:AAA domain-containing protein [Zopfochytrium polystomum]